jgi:hypothetical protein
MPFRDMIAIPATNEYIGIYKTIILLVILYGCGTFVSDIKGGT